MIKTMKNLHFINVKEKNMRKDKFSINRIFLGQLVLVDQGDAHIYQYNDYIYQ